jgi:hypothetical protein
MSSQDVYTQAMMERYQKFVNTAKLYNTYNATKKGWNVNTIPTKIFLCILTLFVLTTLFATCKFLTLDNWKLIVTYALIIIVVLVGSKKLGLL